MGPSERLFPRGSALAAVILAALSAFASRAEAQDLGIVDGPGMRLAGTHTFVFNPAGGGGTITWSLDRETVSDSGVRTRTNGIASGTGPAATFSLSAGSGHETLYYVQAVVAGLQDIDTVQVVAANTKTWFTYRSAGNPDVRVYAVFPSTLSAATRVLMAMHGNSRTASSYADTWRSWATSQDYIVLCPHYDEVNWPTTGMYQMGNVFDEDDCDGAMNPEERWTFTINLGIHQQVREGFALIDPRFDLWGFSGGGQYVHRFMLFKPDAPVRLAIAAGSGWYTAPDDHIDCPYGPDHALLDFAHKDVLSWTNRDMVIMVGTADTLRDEDLRVTTRADAQGRNRFERAGYMVSKAFAFNPTTRWRRVDVPGAGHESKPMALAAQSVLLLAVAGGGDPPGLPAPRIRPVVRVHPNPLTSTSQLSGEDWAGGEVTVDLHDLAGRKVAARTVRAVGGKWRLAWSSLALHGRMPTGVYLVRARGGSQHAEQKVLVLQ